MRKRRYDLIVFDWDGTLADSTSIIARSIRDALRDMVSDHHEAGEGAKKVGTGKAVVDHLGLRVRRSPTAPPAPM